MNAVTIYGWDASHYDSIPDMSRVVAEGFSFMTHKIGGDGSDAEFAAWWKVAKDHRDKLLLGAYWVLRPDLSGSATDKADLFIANLDSKAPGWRDAPFILQLDCESWGDSSGKKKPNKAYVKACCDRLRAKAPKLMPIVYASAGDYGDGLSGLGYPLWNARYVLSYKTGTASGLYSQCGGDSGKGWNRYSGVVPAVWQYTSSATIVGQTTCDANAYRGTLAELTKLVAPGWATEVKENDVELTDKFGDAAFPARTVQSHFKDAQMERDVWWGDPTGTKVAKLPPTSPLAKVIGLPDVVAKLSAAVQAIGKQVGVSTAELKAAIDQVDDQVVAQLQDNTRSNGETAQLLVSLLGDRAAAVAQLILNQGSAPTA